MKKEQPYWTYKRDNVTGAEYISLSNTVGRTSHVSGTKVLREGLIIDMNAIGEIVGVEILPEDFPKETLPQTGESN